ncbi:hypothetical protein CGRA01v4_10369 [Colletotrichum graminicola]|nr:hypothetical protein CGRA01v4_10369 [Colletotrichum graminicola]
MFREEGGGEPSTSSPRRVTRNLPTMPPELGTGTFVVSVLYPPNVFDLQRPLGPRLSERERERERERKTCQRACSSVIGAGTTKCANRWGGGCVASALVQGGPGILPFCFDTPATRPRT